MKNPYALTEVQVEALAAERTAGLAVTEAFDGTYLKVLVNAAQAKFGVKRGKRLNTKTQIDALKAIAAPFYAAVLRGVITREIVLTPDLPAAEVTVRTRERNRRATFARTAKSTLVAWVNEGGDLRALDIASVTKSELRASVAAARNHGETPASSRVERAQKAIMRAVAKEAPAVARERLESVIIALQEAIEELPETDGRHESARIPASRPSFHELGVGAAS